MFEKYDPSVSKSIMEMTMAAKREAGKHKSDAWT